MSYEFDERTDKPKRYCSAAKMCQQEMPKVDELRCRYCCERLTVGANWNIGHVRTREYCCSSCATFNLRTNRACGPGARNSAAYSGLGLCRYVAARLRGSANRRGKSVTSINELESEIKRFLRVGCAMCGCALRLRDAGEGGMTPGTLQVDCIDPYQGYIVGNIQGLCPNCNNLKGHHTLETAERLYKHLLAHEYKRKYGFELHHLPVKPIPVEPPEVPTRG